nr:alpha/beta hydrolase [Anaerolineae bacterium]
MPDIKVNDLKMHYTERGSGPSVVALHAATVSSEAMNWLAQSIARSSFNIITPDLRGHGQTQNPAGDLHLSRLVDDLLEFVYMLGRGPVHGAGFSLGGAVALYAALRKPEMFRSLVLLGSNYRAPSNERLESILGLVENRAPMQQQVFNPDTGVVVGWDQPVEAFRTVSCPTLIITGDRDEFNDIDDNLALYKVLPNASLLVIPGAGHLGPVNHPMVHQAVQDFYGWVPK